MSSYEPDRRATAPRGGNRFLITALLIAVIAMATLQVRAWWVAHAAAATAPRAIAPRGDLDEDEKETIALFEETSPSVVFIATSSLQRDFYRRNIYKIPAGTGSGFIWDKAGHVVTNYHVIRGAVEAQVTLWDGTAWDAKLVGYEIDKDIAVIKISAPPDRLRPIKVGQSSNLLVGQEALAIGNPFGFDQTLTNGVISALGREIESLSRRPIQDVIQTNAAINPGNSGGPLLDSAGRLIGINTAIYSPTGSYAGIGFAVPVDTINHIVPQLIELGKVIKPGLGIVMGDERFVRRLGLEGVAVSDVVRGSGAQRADIEPPRRNGRGELVFDLITEVNGRKIKGIADLYRALDNRTVGDQVKVTVLREGDEKELEVELSALNSD